MGHKFKTLDAMRGVAALVVAAGHLKLALPGFNLAVDVFFILSGFVLAHSYEHRLREGMTLMRFAKLRLIRLYPLFLVGMALGIIAYDISHFSNATFEMIGARLLFFPLIPNPDNHWVDFTFDRPTWSLFFEIAVSIGYAVVIRRGLSRSIFGIILVSIVLLVCISTRAGGIEVGWGGRPLNFLAGFPRCALGFFLGVALYQCYKNGIFYLTASPTIVLLLMVGALAIPSVWGFGRTALDLTLVITVFPVLVGIAATNDLGSNLFDKILKQLGVASYGIYVLHLPIVELIKPETFVSKIAALGCVMIAALVLDKFYDQPVRRWLRSRSTDRQSMDNAHLIES